MLVTAMSVLPGEARADDSIFTSTPVTLVYTQEQYRYQVTTSVAVDSWSIVSSQPTVTINETGYVSGYGAFDPGTYTMSIAATVGGTVYYQNFTVTAVSFFSSTPVRNAEEGVEYTYQITTREAAESWNMTLGPEWLSIDENGLVTGTPPFGAAGEHEVVFWVYVYRGEVLEHYVHHFTITVAPGDIFDSEPLTSVIEGHPYVYQVVTIIPGCTFELTLGPSWLSIDPSTGLLAGTPPAGSSDLGSYPIEITATTPEGVEYVQFWPLDVLPDATIAITSEPVLNATANITYEYQVTCRYTVIEWNLTGPEWLSIDENGLISGTAPNGTQGSFPISVRLTMIAGVQVFQNYTLEVVRQPYTAEDGMAMAFGLLAFMMIVSAVVGIVAQSRRRF
jgi:hypothetical protein